MNKALRILILFCLLATPCLAGDVSADAKADIKATALEAGEANFLVGYPAKAESGMIHVVVEIPAGTRAKWETRKDGTGIDWEVKNGSLRVVKYLPYPANYGMIPGTLLPEENGGDGDPLDVILLGPAIRRGRVVTARLIGVLKLTDGGERDDKLIAVVPGDPLDAGGGLNTLTKRFPGVVEILEIWFSGYKGPGEMESGGVEGRESAVQVLEQAILDYRHITPVP